MTTSPSGAAPAEDPLPVDVSVIVVSRGRPGELQRCLAALVPQGAGEVIVCDGVAERLPLEVMREAAVRRARGDLVLLIEAFMEPAATWLSTFASAHARWPAAAVIGGTIVPAAHLDAVNLGLFLCEYAAFAAAGPVTDSVSAANVSYRRTAILPLPDAYRWDTVLHHRDRQAGLRQCDAVVTFHGGYSPGEAAAMRFHYARAYAARRPLSLIQRLMYAAGTLLLPWMLLRRLWRHRTRQGAAAAPIGAWTWTLALLVAWAAGEAVGYVAGAAREERMR